MTRRRISLQRMVSGNRARLTGRHECRHSYASYWLLRASRQGARDYMGHSSITVTLDP